MLRTTGFDQSPPTPEISKIKELLAGSWRFPAFSNENIPVGLMCIETPLPGQ